jgi:hypothetical protein
VDGRSKSFAYNRSSDRLTRTLRLSLGRHVVRIVATDPEGLRTAERWGFRIVRRR